jgi:hypothetical protein
MGEREPSGVTAMKYTYEIDLNRNAFYETEIKSTGEHIRRSWEFSILRQKFTSFSKYAEIRVNQESFLRTQNYVFENHPELFI